MTAWSRLRDSPCSLVFTAHHCHITSDALIHPWHQHCDTTGDPDTAAAATSDWSPVNESGQECFREPYSEKNEKMKNRFLQNRTNSMERKLDPGF